MSNQTNLTDARNNLAEICEPLKYLDSYTWSRQLTEEHRIVYLVSDDRIDFL